LGVPEVQLEIRIEVGWFWDRTIVGKPGRPPDGNDESFARIALETGGIIDLKRV